MNKFKSAWPLALYFAAFIASPAQAQQAATDSISISGNAAVVSDYRFRGISQTNEKAAIQGGFTISHDSGLYIGTWGSSVASFNGTEIDLIAGYQMPLSSAVNLDVGGSAYFYPGGAQSTILEPYANLSGDIGPASWKAGVAWAPSGQASLSNHSALYVSGDLGYQIAAAPVMLKAHMGYGKSKSSLGGLDGDMVDISVGAEFSYKILTLGIAYVNTDVPNPGGFKESIGADGAVVFSLGASF